MIQDSSGFTQSGYRETLATPVSPAVAVGDTAQVLTGVARSAADVGLADARFKRSEDGAVQLGPAFVGAVLVAPVLGGELHEVIHATDGNTSDGHLDMPLEVAYCGGMTTHTHVIPNDGGGHRTKECDIDHDATAPVHRVDGFTWAAAPTKSHTLALDKQHTYRSNSPEGCWARCSCGWWGDHFSTNPHLTAFYNVDFDECETAAVEQGQDHLCSVT